MHDRNDLGQEHEIPSSGCLFGEITGPVMDALYLRDSIGVRKRSTHFLNVTECHFECQFGGGEATSGNGACGSARSCFLAKAQTSICESSMLS